MALDVLSKDGLIIRKLIPLSTLPDAQFGQLCAQISIQETRNGVLFKKGDIDSDLIYLLTGKIVLQAEGLVIETITAESDAAKFAIAHQVPRKIDAIAKGHIRFLRVRGDLLKNLLSNDAKQSCRSVDVAEIHDAPEDWMTALLRLPIFLRLPPANLQKILLSLEAVHFEKGDVIVEQGGRGDYYYLIKEGQCVLTRKPAPNAREIKLAQLSKGDTFGEDALLSDAPRNVTITALTDMVLLRLEKQLFITLIKEPSLRFLNYTEACEAQTSGATLLDVRYQDEYENRHLAGSINVPFFTLRSQLKNLNKDKPVIVVCRNGRASQAAAFFLLKNKFDALILKDGMECILSKSKSKELAAQFKIDDGIEIPVKTTEHVLLDKAEGTEAAANIDGTEAIETDIREQIKLLRVENEALVRTVEQLRRNCEKLEQEKIYADKKYQALHEKMDRLTQVIVKSDLTATPRS